jgi:pimeloyl-ACP methyl ester carboxylesterase
MVGHTMQYKRGDISIYYETIGRGKPLLLIHGFTTDHRLMKGCMEPVFRKKSGWKRIYIDLPGMGRSKAPSVKNADDMVDVLMEFLGSVVPSESFALAGESYGAHLSSGITNAVRDRVSGLLFICPVVFPESVGRTVPPFTVRRRDDAFMKRLTPEQEKDFQPMAVVQSKELTRNK